MTGTITGTEAAVAFLVNVCLLGGFIFTFVRYGRSWLLRSVKSDIDEIKRQVVPDEDSQDTSAASTARIEAALLQLTSTLRLAILWVDGEGLVTSMNARAELLTGYKATELIGQSVEVLVPDRMIRSHFKLRQDYLAHPAPRMMGTVDVALQHKSGREIPCEIALTPILSAGATTIQVSIETKESGHGWDAPAQRPDDTHAAPVVSN